MSWFNKKKKTSNTTGKVVKTALKPLDYHPKIILAWIKAIEGNEKVIHWLNTNGYPELVIASSAILLNNEARDWLMKNGYPHLMAMINAAEGISSAQSWLKKHKFELLFHIAMAVEDENNSWIWLRTKASPDIFMLAQAIKKVKDKIEENHNDIHSFGKDL
ncbi:MAG: hypothetical protein HYR91_03275 [Flavobacteriia bacterium]|nr:hypothetical protein [Flavobacteriia bacterium]